MSSKNKKKRSSLGKGEYFLQVNSTTENAVHRKPTCLNLKKNVKK